MTKPGAARGREDLLAKVVAITSGKGGVGKTTLGFLLGLVLQRAQRRVNFLDLDPQASLSSLLELHNVKRDESAATEFLIVDTPPRLESKEVRGVTQTAVLNPQRRQPSLISTKPTKIA